jgi:hypothetical protein
MTSINNLATLLQSLNKLSEAEPLLQEALLARRRTLGDSHPNTLSSINNLAILLQSEGKLAQAVGMRRGGEARMQRSGDNI